MEHHTMLNNYGLRQELLTKIQKLPDHQLSKVLQFVNTLPTLPQPSTQPVPQEVDPLSSFIGGVSHGDLAHNADAELYAP